MGAQKRRVLRALQRHPKGICQADFDLPNVIDGGGRISRVAARIYDLREQGHEIDVVGKRFGFDVYQLRVQAPASPESCTCWGRQDLCRVCASARTATPEQAQEPDAESEPKLFDLPRRAASPYDQDAA